MNIRVRYTGEKRLFLKPEKVYYFELTQFADLRINLIQLPDRERAVTYKNLESFLDDFKILTIKKELKYARHRGST